MCADQDARRDSTGMMKGTNSRRKRRLGSNSGLTLTRGGVISPIDEEKQRLWCRRDRRLEMGRKGSSLSSACFDFLGEIQRKVKGGRAQAHGI